jgi:glycopeptide antibiotics resistance protein
VRLNRLFLLAWIAVILTLVVPWTSFQNHAHLQRVDWLPFLTPPVRLRDVVLNTMLYLPFGYLHARAVSRARAWHTAAYAFALSLATEVAQVFSHGRFPSATDVTCNLAGACWGFWWSRATASVRRPPG